MVYFDIVSGESSLIISLFIIMSIQFENVRFPNFSKETNNVAYDFQQVKYDFFFKFELF